MASFAGHSNLGRGTVVVEGRRIDGFQITAVIILAKGPGGHAMSSISLNVIRIGSEQFTSADESTITSAINYTRAVYGTVGVTVKSVEHYHISNAQAGAYLVIDDDVEASSLTSQWTVQNNAIDVFVVKLYVGARAGLSPTPGPCNKDLPYPNMTVSSSSSLNRTPIRC